jgi:hypothetical protein
MECTIYSKVEYPVARVVASCVSVLPAPLCAFLYLLCCTAVRESNVFFRRQRAGILPSASQPDSARPSYSPLSSSCPPPAEAMYSFTGLFVSSQCLPLSALYLYCFLFRESNVFFRWPHCFPRAACVNLALDYSLRPCCGTLLLGGHESNVFFRAPGSLASVLPYITHCSRLTTLLFSLAYVYFYDAGWSSNSFLFGCTFFARRVSRSEA